MKRTTTPNTKSHPWDDPKNDKPFEIVIDRTNIPIQITQETLSILHKIGYEPALFLYTFLVKATHWQNTNRVYATNNFIRKGLTWGEDKLLKSKKILKELGLIKIIKKRDSKKRNIIKTYIQVNYAVKAHHLDYQGGENKYTQNLDLSHPELSMPKILYNSSLKRTNYGNQKVATPNTPSKSLLDKDPNKKTFVSLSKQLSKIIQDNKNINPHPKLIITNWANSFRILMNNRLKKNGTPFKDVHMRVAAALKYYEKHIGEKYCKVILSGEAFKNKFLDLENAMERDKDDYNQKDPNDNSANFSAFGDDDYQDPEELEFDDSKEIKFDLSKEEVTDQGI